MMLTGLFGAVTTFVACWALVFTQTWHGRFSMDINHGVQKFHTRPTPRIGSVGLMIGLSSVIATAPDHWASLLAPLFLASFPALIVGIAEDVTKAVAPSARLAATVGSGVMACLLSSTALAHTGVPWFDAVLQSWWPLAVAFTAFAVGGIANAINIVDGFNGLASGVVIICLCALGAMALEAKDHTMAHLFFAMAAVVSGFLAVNFPMGKIFLGDGGAYVLGFWLAWLSVLLIERNPSISPVAVLLACAYPVVEVVFSVCRRLTRGHPPMHPDRLHLHSLVKSRLARKQLTHWTTVMQNASVSPFIWIVASGPAILGVWCWNTPAAAWSGLAAFAVGYAAVYRRLVLFSWR